MSAESPINVFNCSIGAALQGPQVLSGETMLSFFGANLTPAAAASALTVFHADGVTPLLTLGVPASQATVNVLMPSLASVIGGSIKYTLSGAGATAQIYSAPG